MPIVNKMRLVAARAFQMKARLRLPLLVIALLVSCLSSGTASANVGRDAQVAGASLSMTSDPGDYIGRGQSYAFATPSDVFLAGTNEDRSSLRIREISPDFTHFWELDFSAPDGQQLTPGTYSGAVRDVVHGSGEPGLDVNGDGSGCNTLTGSFTVLDAAFGPNGYVERFDATFEQHCGGNTPALRGEVRIANTSPPPPRATVEITIDPTAELGAHGTATVHGTITCSVAPYNPYAASSAPTIMVTVTQVTKNGSTSLSNAAFPSSCTPTPTPWTATTPWPYKGMAYVKGLASVTASTTIADPIYPLLSDDGSASADVALKEG